MEGASVRARAPPLLPPPPLPIATAAPTAAITVATSPPPHPLPTQASRPGFATTLAQHVSVNTHQAGEPGQGSGEVRFEFAPCPGRHFAMYNGRFVMVERSRADQAMMDMNTVLPAARNACSATTSASTSAATAAASTQHPPTTHHPTPNAHHPTHITHHPIPNTEHPTPNTQYILRACRSRRSSSPRSAALA